MVKYYNGEMFVIPKEFEEEIRADEKAKIVGDCLTILKAMHMIRTSEEDFNPQIETPFYRELYAIIKKLGEEQK